MRARNRLRRGDVVAAGTWLAAACASAPHVALAELYRPGAPPRAATRTTGSTP